MANLDKGAVQTGGLDKGAVQSASALVATWAAALDTNISIDVTAANVRKRLRVEIQNTGVASSGGSFKWQYRKNSGSWSDITASSSDVKTFDSTYFSDGDDCSQLLGAGTYQADNNAAEDSSGAFSLTAGLAAATAFESEIALEFIKADLVDTDVLEFRIVTSAGVLDTYSAIPQATIIETLAAGSAVGYGTATATVTAHGSTIIKSSGMAISAATAAAIARAVKVSIGSVVSTAIAQAASKTVAAGKGTVSAQSTAIASAQAFAKAAGTVSAQAVLFGNGVNANSGFTEAVGTVSVSAAIAGAAKTLALAGGSCVAISSAQAISKIIRVAVGNAQSQAVAVAAGFTRQRISAVGNATGQATANATGVDAAGGAPPVGRKIISLREDMTATVLG